MSQPKQITFIFNILGHKKLGMHRSSLRASSRSKHVTSHCNEITKINDQFAHLAVEQSV